jgi:hypothetical protein
MWTVRTIERPLWKLVIPSTLRGAHSEEFKNKKKEKKEKKEKWKTRVGKSQKRK